MYTFSFSRRTYFPILPQQVRNIIRNFRHVRNPEESDAQDFVAKLMKEEVFFRFTLDAEDRLGTIFWASEDQVYMARQYSSVIIQDNTFNTNA